MEAQDFAPAGGFCPEPFVPMPISELLKPERQPLPIRTILTPSRPVDQCSGDPLQPKFEKGTIRDFESRSET
jgi:hypothetical protein